MTPAPAIPGTVRRWSRAAWMACAVLLLAVDLGASAVQAAEVPASAGVRRALVVGNAKYRTLPLANPENDARLIAERLRGLGFEVALHVNLGAREFRRVLRDYARSLHEKEGVAVFYYAGHGVQIDGRNYLLPVDINLASEDEVKDDSVDIEEVFVSRLEGARAQARIVILDACRDDPFPKRRTRNIRVAGGLAEMAARGTLIAYASAPGATAEDGPGGSNSVYTRHLAQAMLEPGLEVEQMFKRVRVGVLQDTKERQVPWVNTSLTVNFSFNPRIGPDPAEVARQERVRRLESELSRTRELLEQARLRMVEAEAAQRAGATQAAGGPAPALGPVASAAPSTSDAGRAGAPATPSAPAAAPAAAAPAGAGTAPPADRPPQASTAGAAAPAASAQAARPAAPTAQAGPTERAGDGAAPRPPASEPAASADAGRRDTAGGPPPTPAAADAAPASVAVGASPPGRPASAPDAAPAAAPVPGPIASAAPTATPAVAAPASTAAAGPATDLRQEFFRLQEQLKATEEALQEARREADAKVAATIAPTAKAAGSEEGRSPGASKAARCTDLLGRLSLGESLSADGQDFLRRECR